MNFKDLIQDPIYRAWFKQAPPKLRLGYPHHNWRIFVRLESGKWAKLKVDFKTYEEAYNWVVQNYKKYEDVVLMSKQREYRPPVISVNGKKTYWPSPRGYHWCGYCRRPTKFRNFSHHHAVPIYGDTETKRCEICGVRLEFLKKYPSSIVSSWEPRAQ